MNEKEIAGLFMQGFDCGQAVLANFAEELGMTKDMAYKLAAGLGGGMFRGQTCGAVAGAIIALGMEHGHHEPNTPERKEHMMAKTLEFQKRFMEKYPSTACRELLGYDVSKPEDMEIIMEKGLFLSFCPKVTADVIEILEGIL